MSPISVFALTDALVVISSTTVSDHVKTVKIGIDVEKLDTTAMGTSGYTSFIGGLKSGTITLELEDDMAAASINALLWPLIGTSVPFEIRPTSGTVTTTNPKWTGNILITQDEFGGKVGDLAMKSLTFPTTGTVTMATT